MDTEIDPMTPTQLAGDRYSPLIRRDAQLDSPMLLIDLNEDISSRLALSAAHAARKSDRVLVGVRTVPGPPDPFLASALDLTFAQDGTNDQACIQTEDPGAHAREFAEIAAENVRAALLLSQVLKTTETMPVPAALDVESFAYSTLLGGPDFLRWLDRRGPRPLPPLASSSPVLLERHADRLRVTLNRVERRNAYGAEVRDGLVSALRLAIFDDTIRRIVIDGAGPSFCAGGDLDEFGTTPDLTTAHLIRSRAGAGRLVDQLREQVEVYVHGSCVGAGIEIPAFATKIVADPNSIFWMPEVGMGLLPGAGGTVSIPRRIGRHRAFYLFVTGLHLDAHSALEWGLVDEIVP